MKIYRNQYREEAFFSVVILMKKVDIGELKDLFKLMHHNYNNYEVIIVTDYKYGFHNEFSINNFNSELTARLIIVKISSLEDEEMALAAGVDLSIGDYIVEIPNPANIDDWEYMERMRVKSKEGYDFVFCTPCKTPFSSRLFYKIINKTYGNYVDDCFNAVMILSSRRGQNKVSNMGERIVNRNIAYMLCGAYYSKIKGPEKYKNNRSTKKNWKLFVNSLVYYTDYMTKFTFFIKMIFFLCSCSMGIYSILAKFLINTAYGWSSTICFLSMGFAGVFLILSIITIYLDSILKNTMNAKK